MNDISAFKDRLKIRKFSTTLKICSETCYNISLNWDEAYCETRRRRASTLQYEYLNLIVRGFGLNFPFVSSWWLLTRWAPWRNIHARTFTQFVFNDLTSFSIIAIIISDNFKQISTYFPIVADDQDDARCRWSLYLLLATVQSLYGKFSNFSFFSLNYSIRDRFCVCISWLSLFIIKNIWRFVSGPKVFMGIIVNNFRFALEQMTDRGLKYQT